MKRLLLVATSALCLVVFFFACSDLQNLSEPKKVVVKPGDAKYSIPFGGYSVALDDYLNVTKLQENLRGDDEDSGDTKPKLSVYDYQDPAEKYVQKYIIEYPITSISLNPDDYLGNMLGFLDDINGTGISDNDDKFNISVAIPDELKNGVSLSETVDLPNLNEEIVNKIGEFEISKDFSFLVPEREGALDSHTLLKNENDDVITIPLDFKTLQFSSGSLDIRIRPGIEQGTPDERYRFMVKAFLQSKDTGIEIAESDTIVFGFDTTEEKVISIPLAEKDLYPEMRIVLQGEVVDVSDSWCIHTYTITHVGFTKNNLKVKKVTGLNTESITKEVDQSFGNGENAIGGDLLRTATVEEGNITLSSELPGGWSGVTAAVDFAVGGAIDGINFKEVNKNGYLLYREANLAGKPIDGKQSLSATLNNITLSFNNATIVLEDEQPKVSVACKSNITKLKDVTVSLQKLLADEELTSKIDQEIGSNITDYVESALVDELNLQAEIDTNLEVKELWVKPTIKSTALKIDNALEEYTNVVGDPIRVSYGKENDWGGFDLADLQNGTVDFEITLAVRGDNHEQKPYDEADDTLTLTSFDLTRDDYYLKTKFGAPKDKHIFECERLVLKIGDDIISKGPIETGLSIGDMFDNLVEDKNSEQGKLIDKLINAIELQGIEGYLYVTAPKVEGEDAIDFAKLLPSITGYVEASYVPKDSDAAKTEVLIGNESGDKKIELMIKNNVPSFASLADENLLITKDDMFTKHYSAKTAEDSLCKIINDRANDLKFDYDISFGGGEGNTITLNREQINALQDAANAAAGGSAGANAEIAMTIAVVLPLELNITEDIEVENIMTLASDKDEDIDLLGGGDSDSDYSEYSDYIKALRSLTLIYGLENSFGLKGQATLSEKNGSIGEKKMNFNTKRDVIIITPDEVDRIIKKNSFIPRVSMTLNKGSVSVTRNAELKMNAALVIKTNNDAEIEFEL